MEICHRILSAFSARSTLVKKLSDFLLSVLSNNSLVRMSIVCQMSEVNKMCMKGWLGIDLINGT